MYLLYLDDSGSVKNAADEYVILAGVCVFERVPYHFSASLDKIAERIWPDNPHGLEFHGSDIFSGKKHWRGLDRKVRMDAYKEALSLLGESRRVHLFGAVIHKAAISPADAIEYAFEQLANRFDRFLSRQHRKNDNLHRGLIVFDKSASETTIQSLAHEFRELGHRWGQLHYMADVPFFVDSRATRMIQYADLIAYALRRYYIKGEPEYYDLIANRFDSEGGVIHGLVHYTPQNSSCVCAVCKQRNKTPKIILERKIEISEIISTEKSEA